MYVPVKATKKNQRKKAQNNVGSQAVSQLGSHLVDGREKFNFSDQRSGGNRTLLSQPIQKRTNSTGLPDKLKSGIENLSGYSLDDVKVHYHSKKPAQLQAHAYTQGANIHVSSGQEKHLPHEAWHVVQQKQGRVKPTHQIGTSVSINNSARLEKEADRMGHKSLQGGATQLQRLSKEAAPNSSTTVQLASKALKGALIGGAIGSIVPIFGTAIGAKIGYEKGKKRDYQQLLHDGVTPEQAKFMMQREPSAYTIHTQIMAEEGKKVRRIYNLYSIGLTSKEISILLAFHSNAYTIYNQVRSEKEKNPSRIRQLYIDGLQSSEISALLDSEPDAEKLHKQIIDADENAHGIYLLYTDGLKSDEVSNLLVVTSDPLKIHQNLTQVVSSFTLGNIRFASKTGEKVGSIYFNGGRVRLIHSAQPCVELHEGNTYQTTLAPDDVELCWTYWEDNVKTKLSTVADFYAYAQTLPSFRMAAAGVGGTLVEFFDDSWHPSRGTPMPFNYGLRQFHLNLIGNVAQQKNNVELKEWMQAIPALKAIQMDEPSIQELNLYLARKRQAADAAARQNLNNLMFGI